MEDEALAKPCVLIGTRQTQRLRESVALPTTDNPLCVALMKHYFGLPFIHVIKPAAHLQLPAHWH